MVRSGNPLFIPLILPSDVNKCDGFLLETFFDFFEIHCSEEFESGYAERSKRVFLETSDVGMSEKNSKRSRLKH